jgi:hypothetical protein
MQGLGIRQSTCVRWETPNASCYRGIRRPNDIPMSFVFIMFWVCYDSSQYSQIITFISILFCVPQLTQFTFIYWKLKFLSADRYEGSSKISRTFIQNRLIIFPKIIPIFLYILPASLYSVNIAPASSLCPFQKSVWLLVQPPLQKKSLTSSSSALNLFQPRASLSG